MGESSPDPNIEMSVSQFKTFKKKQGNTTLKDNQSIDKKSNI